MTQCNNGGAVCAKGMAKVQTPERYESLGRCTLLLMLPT
jgi:hypothetical protein